MIETGGSKMIDYRFIRNLCIFSVVLVFDGCKGTGLKNEKNPNIIIITADDLGLHLGCYGDTIVHTPNLDKFADRSTKFINAYVTQASCSPSRSSILTGTYPHYNGQIGLAHLGFQISREVESLPAALMEAGYYSGIIGKLHVQPDSIFPFHHAYLKGRETRDVALVADRAEEIIDRAENKPFFLYINYFDPHVPFITQVNEIPEKPINRSEVSAFSFQRIDDREQLERISGYYNCVERLDTGIGLLLKMLQDKDLTKETMIFFLGDHGSPFCRAKTAAYEASLKVPFIVSLPGQREGHIDQNLISTVDILPTIYDLIGIEPEHTIQGKSFMPLLNRDDYEMREFLFAEFNFHGNKTEYFFPRRTVNNGRFKLIYNITSPEHTNNILSIDGDEAYKLSRKDKYDGTVIREVFDRFHAPPEFELYDLELDPDELYNLAKDTAFSMQLENLKAELFNWMRSTEDPYLKKVNAYQIYHESEKTN